jgi:hypothetical protein
MVLGGWAMNGAASFVTTFGRRGGWVVTVGGQRVPKVFHTKRAAVAHAELAVAAFLEPVS